MLESLFLGALQGIAEWLPISSEGLFVLAKINLFGANEGIGILIQQALFLHLGTFFAALIYFRKDVMNVLRGMASFSSTAPGRKILIRFLVIATTISAIVGLFFIIMMTRFSGELLTTGKIITVFIGILLLITAIIQLRAKKNGYKNAKQLTRADGILLGVVQGFSVLPGLSRSGITVSTLLLRKFDDFHALRLSFLLSLPLVLGGNILLNLRSVSFEATMLWGLLSSFVFGLLTIGALMKLAHKINFGYFVLIFALITFLAVMI